MAEQEKINKDNMLIAEFMEVDFSLPYMWKPGAYTELTVEHLVYNTSWGWLMPAVEKILKEDSEGIYKIENIDESLFKGDNLLNNVYKFVLNHIKNKVNE